MNENLKNSQLFCIVDLIVKQALLLMPLFQAVPSKRLVRTLHPFRPPHPLRLRITHNTNHLLGDRQIRINRRRKRMNQLGVVMIPQPQHCTAVRAEVSLRRAALFVRCTA